MFGTWRVRTILRADLGALAYRTQSSHREILIRHLLDPFLLHLAYVRSAAPRSSARRQASYVRGAGGFAAGRALPLSGGAADPVGEAGREEA